VQSFLGRPGERLESAREDPFRAESTACTVGPFTPMPDSISPLGFRLNWLDPHCQQDVAGRLGLRQAKAARRPWCAALENLTK